jgi:hypothetical protein
MCDWCAERQSEELHSKPRGYVGEHAVWIETDGGGAQQSTADMLPTTASASIGAVAVRNVWRAPSASSFHDLI